MDREDKSWEHDNLYFVFPQGENVSVISSRVVDINGYRGGSRRPISAGCHSLGDIQVYCKRFWNIRDDGFKGYSDVGLEAFLKGLLEGETSLYWEIDGRWIPYGRHVFRKAEFEDWIDKRKGENVLPLKLILATEDDYLFSAVEDI